MIAYLFSLDAWPLIQSIFDPVTNSKVTRAVELLFRAFAGLTQLAATAPDPGNAAGLLQSHNVQGDGFPEPANSFVLLRHWHSPSTANRFLCFNFNTSKKEGR